MTLRHRGAWGTYSQRGHQPSRGETAKPRQVPKALTWLPPFSMDLRLPEDLALQGDGDAISAWFDQEAARWLERHTLLDPGGRAETVVFPHDRGRVTVRWVPGDTEPHPTPTGRPGTRIR